MARPLVLDLFCGAGGAAMGYHRAGFDVLGVDIRPQPNYPFPFVRADALQYLELLPVLQGDVKAIHASPPCQPYSRAVTSRSSRWNDTKGKDEPALIDDLLPLLRLSGKPWVLENVEGAPLDGITLCGSMFGLDIPRHRVFKTSFWMPQPHHEPCRGIAKAAAERRGWDYRDMTVTGKGRRAGTSARWAELLGVDWPMRQRDLKEAIPPAYTQFVGTWLMGQLVGGVRLVPPPLDMALMENLT